MTSQLLTPSLPSAVAAEQTYLQIPSQPEWIAPTVEYLKEKAILCGACPQSRANKLMLVLHEALTNSVIHGNLELSSELKEQSDNAFAEALAERSVDPHYSMRPVEVRVEYDGDRCRWTFTDQGKGFDVERVLARAAQAEPEEMLASGRGLLLMRAFLDDLRYEMGGRRAILTLARPAGEEKRRAERWSMQRPVRIAPVRGDGSVDWDSAHEALTQNLSTEGIGILQAHLAQTDRILIGIDWHGQLLYIPAEVRHCQARDGEVFELGCRFQVSPASAERDLPFSADMDRAIGSLLDQLNDASIRPDERRAHTRAAYTARITIERDSDSRPLIGFGRDLSKGGMSFLTSTPLPFETVVLSLPQHDQPPLRVLAKIVRCNQLMAGVFDVGARFVDVVTHREQK